MTAMAPMDPMDYRDITDENEGPRILGATLTVTTAALITTVLRMYVRIGMIKNVSWDDYTMIISMLLCFVGQVIIVPEVLLGAGRHKQFIDPQDFAEGFRLNFITQPIYLTAIGLIKISVGFFLLRVAVAKLYRRIIIGVMAFMTLYTTGCLCTILLQCTNLAVQWDASAQGTCWPGSTIKVLSTINVACNITTDLLFSVFIPIPLLWSLQMNKRVKLTLMGILGLGVFATIAALVKTAFLSSYGLTGDWLWDSRNLTIWTVVESCMGIIAGNLPCMKPLFHVVLGGSGAFGTARSRTQRVSASTTAERRLTRRETRSKGAAGFVMTTIRGGGENQEDAKKMDVSSGGGSFDNIAALAVRPMSGIVATTKVDVVKSSNDDVSLWDGDEAHGGGTIWFKRDEVTRHGRTYREEMARIQRVHAEMA